MGINQDSTKLNICFFSIKDKNLLKNEKKSGINSKTILMKNLIVNPFTIKKIYENEIKPYKGKINTNFYDNTMTKKDCHCSF